MSNILKRIHKTNPNECSISINPNRLLPTKYIIPDSGTHLYRIGLLNIPTNNSVSKSSKYQKYYRYISTTVLSMFFLRSFVSLFQRDDSK
jgi:hypothetical protein